jgi:hypothetical protein
VRKANIEMRGVGIVLVNGGHVPDLADL